MKTEEVKLLTPFQRAIILILGQIARDIHFIAEQGK